MRGKHEKRPSVSREAFAEMVKEFTASTIKAEIVKLVVNAIMKALGKD